MGRVGACSLSGCRMAAMRRLLGLLVCLPVACYSQGIPREYCNGRRCPADAPDCDYKTKRCYYHYGKGCDIGGAGSCCSNSVCERRTPHAPVCTERGYCHPPSYQPTGPGCTIYRGRVECSIDMDPDMDRCPPNRECFWKYTAGADSGKMAWSGGGLSELDKCAILGRCRGLG